jgi:hypothetical protein
MSAMQLTAFNTGVAEWTAKDFKDEMLSLWEQLQPFYNQLHAYLRMKLRQNPSYGDKIEKTGSLPIWSKAGLFPRTTGRRFTGILNPFLPPGL